MSDTHEHLGVGPRLGMEESLVYKSVNDPFGACFLGLAELGRRDKVAVRNRPAYQCIFFARAKRNQLPSHGFKCSLCVLVQRQEDAFCVIGQCTLKLAQVPIIGPAEQAVFPQQLLSV